MKKTSEFNRTDKAIFSSEWDKICFQVRLGLNRIGHDIPLTGYTDQEMLKQMTEKRRLAGISQKQKGVIQWNMDM